MTNRFNRVFRWHSGKNTEFANILAGSNSVRIQDERDMPDSNRHSGGLQDCFPLGFAPRPNVPHLTTRSRLNSRTVLNSTNKFNEYSQQIDDFILTFYRQGRIDGIYYGIVAHKHE